MRSYRKSCPVRVNVSVVIPTYGRGDRLGATLGALLASDTRGLDAVEIIVVDDGSPEPVDLVVEGRVACPPVSLSCIRQPMPPGLPRPCYFNDRTTPPRLPAKTEG